MFKWNSKKQLIAVLTITMAGCSATQPTSQGAQVEIVAEKPADCRVLGEVVGSQGNVFSGDFTSNENLMVGARNDLRNKAAALGANTVQVQQSLNATHPYSAGAVKTTLVGTAYSCPR